MMKNHKKAKEFCEREIYIEEGAKEGFIDMITSKILNAPTRYTLKGLMEDLGTTFAHSEPKEAIGVLEAIHDVLGLEKIKEFTKDKRLDFTNQDDLFEEAFNNMYETAKQYSNEDLLKQLETYLETEKPQGQHEEVVVVGVGSGDTENTEGH